MPIPVTKTSGKAESGRCSLYSGHPSHWSGKSLKQDSFFCNPTPLTRQKTAQIFKLIKTALVVLRRWPKLRAMANKLAKAQPPKVIVVNEKKEFKYALL